MIEQHNQIKPRGSKFVFGSVSYKEVDLEVQFNGSVIQLCNRDIGKVDPANPPIPACQP
jgi:hypothetical protein